MLCMLHKCFCTLLAPCTTWSLVSETPRKGLPQTDLCTPMAQLRDNAEVIRMQAFLRGVLGPRPQLHFVFAPVLDASTTRQAGACPDRQAKSGCHQGGTEISLCLVGTERVFSNHGAGLHIAFGYGPVPGCASLLLLVSAAVVPLRRSETRNHPSNMNNRTIAQMTI